MESIDQPQVEFEVKPVFDCLGNRITSEKLVLFKDFHVTLVAATVDNLA